MIEIAIVGLGSWGLCVLERIVDRASVVSAAVRVHVVEPNAVGGGVYSVDQPDYLVLNNACGQLSLYVSPDGDGTPPYAASLYKWAVRQDYRWVGYECRRGEGVPVAPTDYLPRRLMGEYLSWFYRTLIAAAPPNLEVVEHSVRAVDILSEAAGRERVMLADGAALVVDHVVLTSGHTFNEEPEGARGPQRSLRPYPVDYFAAAPAPGVPLAIGGMGLVGFDVLIALTVGRGGSFVDDGPRKRYVPSRHEPKVFLYSRSGLPYCAKSAHGIDPTGDYQPVVCTPEVLAAVSHRGGLSGGRGQADFRADLLPLLYAEMQSRFHIQSARLAGGPAAESEARAVLSAGWVEGHYDQVVAAQAAVHGPFDPAAHVFAGDHLHHVSSKDYEDHVYTMVEQDLDECLHPGGSPVKAAQEVLRILRDPIRSVIEFGGLSLDSYVDFQANIRSRINRLEAGPPPLRSQQLLALMDAGVVRVPFGPSPTVTRHASQRTVIRSTRLTRPVSHEVAAVVRGHLDLPSLERSASPLLSRLYRQGRLTQLRYGDTAVGSVAISEDFHPYDAEGRLQSNISLLGVLTEGVRYFTHYLPSPRSRLRAILDAQSCVEGVLG